VTDDPTNVLVTGGSGFLGGRVLPLLVARGGRVTALVRSAAAATVVTALGAEPLPGDLDDPATLDKAFGASGAHALVNLASLGFGHAPAIVAASERAGITRGIFVSTTAIFTTIDAASKPRRLAGETTVRESGLDWTVLRPTMIYGTPGDRNLSRLLGLLRRSPIVPIPGGGGRLQQPVHVDDVAAAVVAALDGPASIHRAYELAGPEAMTFRELVTTSAAAVGRRPRLVPVPLRPCIVALRLYERITPHPRLKAEQLERLAEDKAFTIDDARRDLGFAPRDFADGIRAEALMMRGA
jgi:uncharacterized protein YbjT (DUF2867 family)